MDDALDKNAWLSAIIRDSDDAIVSKTLDGIIMSWNPAAESLFGYSEAEAIGQPMTMVFPKDRLEEEDMLLATIRSGRRIVRFETVRQRKNGDLVDVSVNLSPIYGRRGIVGVSKIAHDITERRQLENRIRESERFTRLISDNVPALIAYWDHNLECKFSNNHHMSLFGKCADEIFGKNIRDLLGAELFLRSEPHIAEALNGHLQNFELPILTPNNGVRYTSVNYVPDVDPNGSVKGIFVLIADITNQKHTEQNLEQAIRDLEQLSRTDGLTGIPNRRCFDETLRSEWQRALRAHTRLGLLLIDIDFFKKYNDYYGHAQGDSCLQQVAGAMAQIIRESPDLIARYGGEEFVCLLPNTDDDGLKVMGRRLVDAVCALRLPHAASEVANHVTISVGGAFLAPDTGNSAKQLLELADQSLYGAKRGGRNRIVTPSTLVSPN